MLNFIGGKCLTKQPFLFLIGGILSLIIAMGIGRFAYTPILPHMQNDLSFSNAFAGYLATSNYAGYLFGALLAGAIPLTTVVVIDEVDTDNWGIAGETITVRRQNGQ